MNANRRRSLGVAMVAIGICAGVVGTVARATDPCDSSEDERLVRAEHALRQHRFVEAVELCNKVIDQKPNSAAAYLLRGRARLGMDLLEQAVADLNEAIGLAPSAAGHFYLGQCYARSDRHVEVIRELGRALELNPRLIAAYHERAGQWFKLGEVKRAITDFDRYIVLNPSHENECWQRGLARYYAGQFAAAQKSFEDYHKVGPNDIENGLWRMLSQAEIVGLPLAQNALFKYEPKRRPPFPLLYELYSGHITPGDAEGHAEDGAADTAEQRTRRFYAQLYLGMWFVANRDHPSAAAHLEKAVALRSRNFMWYVARLQLERSRREIRAAR